MPVRLGFYALVDRTKPSMLLLRLKSMVYNIDRNNCLIATYFESILGFVSSAGCFTLTISVTSSYFERSPSICMRLTWLADWKKISESGQILRSPLSLRGSNASSQVRTQQHILYFTACEDKRKTRQ